MNTPESLNGFISDLIRRGLPTAYSERAGLELADHHRDLVDELEATGLNESQALAEASRRLGDSRAIVKNTVREYQRRYWCARWPLITFLLGPIPLLVITWTVIWMAIVCVFWPLEQLGLFKQYPPDGITTFWELLLNKFVMVLFCFVAPAIAISALARLSKRAALHWVWIAVSACILGLVAGTLNFGFPDTAARAMMMDGTPVQADQPMLVCGVPLVGPSFLAAWKWYTRDLQQICQVLMPAAIAAAILLRAQRLSARSLAASS